RELLFFDNVAGGGNGALGVGDAEHGLTVLAFHQLAAHLIGDGKDFSAAKIWANDLTSHGCSPTLYRPPGPLA
ncbi:MAG TPA: hypothetical protein VGF52_00740, partial [Tepidisphaeraceae bacterium]